MLDLLFADNNIVVCIKPSGVLSQDAGEESMPGLLKRQLSVKEVYTIHRLDREVGGVMVYALNAKAAASLSRAVQERKLEKQYLAVLRGVPEKPADTLKDLLYHDKIRNKTYVVQRVRKGVKDAVLDYEVLTSAENKTLVRVNLHTGRTHQIRAKFAHAGFLCLANFLTQLRFNSFPVYSTKKSSRLILFAKARRSNLPSSPISNWSRLVNCSKISAIRSSFRRILLTCSNNSKRNLVYFFSNAASGSDPLFLQRTYPFL